ncbi:DUF305 domain-containing protein [Tsuneonella deserti]|uniref:DUF305 domain-containing protein n=1 Tax=Tsuneonella deserti TaxID=2035528 RepID=UPI001E2B2A75|nr:DUF305 domain-containing protein [Tsuneonella deserti]
MLFTLVATAALAACGAPSDQPSDDATSAAAPAEAAADPYAESEKRMDDAMTAAVGTDVGDNWARKMIAHHQGAIDMSQVVLKLDPSPDVAEMARMTIDKQGKEIEAIRKLLKDGVPDQKAAELYRPVMTDMHQKMMAASGADSSETFLRKMLEHHKGAVAMSDVALRNGVSGAVRTRVQATRADQVKEVAMVEAMLRGETMDHSAEPAAKASVASPAPAPKPTPVAAPVAKPTKAAKVAPKATVAPAPAAQPSPSATASCSPEHHAMGHC